MRHTPLNSGGKPDWRLARSLFRKAFLLYLVATTGCTSLNYHPQQAQAQQLAVDAQTQQASTTLALPDLGTSQASSHEAEPKPTAPRLMLPAADNDLSGQSGNRQRTQSDTGFESLAMGMLAGASDKAVKDWFSAKHATAELGLAAGEHGMRFGSFDLLLPLHDTANDLFFTQVGIRRSNTYTEDYRNTVNLGLGYRHTFNQWLAGGNVFYDKDITGENERLGLGGEVMTDNLKVSANGYFRLSDWKKSPDLDAYLERPANGFDIRAEGYLPAYPQLGGKLMYEKYYGSNVALFDENSQQANPSAVTVGAIYRPVPMIGMGVDYRQGQGGLQQTTARISFNYQFGVPLSKQLSRTTTETHKLEFSRYNLVSRNNEIILDYKKSEHAQISLPSQVNGSPSEAISFPVTISGGQISNIQWSGTANNYAQPYTNGSGTLTLPNYLGSGINSYTLQAVGTDVYGQRVVSNVMQVVVQPLSISIESSKTSATADGQDAVAFTATLRNSSGSIQPDTAITWAVQGNATVTSQDARTNNAGQARLTLVSRVANTVQVTAQDASGAQAEAATAFASVEVGSINLVATPSSITANGTDTSSIVATVRDTNGNAMPQGTTVTWSTNGGTLSAATGTTDASGQATVSLTGTAAGIAAVAATAGTVSGNTNVTLVSAANYYVAYLYGNPSYGPADGSSVITISVVVVDQDYNPAPAGVSVNWSTSLGNLGAQTSTTDSSGVATVSITSEDYGRAEVHAATNMNEDYTSVNFMNPIQVN